jgi:hypothetical protein
VESNIKVLCLLPLHTLLVVPKTFKHNFFFFGWIPIDPSNATSSNQNLKPLVKLIDLAQVVTNLTSNKKKGKNYELNYHFQDSWATRLPSTKSVVGAKRKITQVKCKVCSIIDGRGKLLVAKLDFLWKHVGRKLATIAFVGVVMGNIYFLKTYQHMINEKLYVQRRKDFVLQ